MRRLFNRTTTTKARREKREFTVCVWHELGNEVKYIYYRLSKRELNLLEKNGVHYVFCNQYHDFVEGLR